LGALLHQNSIGNVVDLLKGPSFDLFAPSDSGKGTVTEDQFPRPIVERFKCIFFYASFKWGPLKMFQANLEAAVNSDCLVAVAILEHPPVQLTVNKVRVIVPGLHQLQSPDVPVFTVAMDAISQMTKCSKLVDESP